MHGFAALSSFVRTVEGLAVSEPGRGVAIWLLVGVFAWSGVAKLRRPTLAAMAIVDFGVTRRARPVLGVLLGSVEVLLATLLALGVLSRLVLALTAMLLWFFALLIARSLRAGANFACFCFGEADDRLSGWTLVRTIALALLASMETLTALSLSSTTVPYATRILQAIAALSLLGTIVLARSIPRLLRQSNHFLENSLSRAGGD